MMQIPDFRDRVNAPGWRDLLDLAPQLMDAPRGLSQHVGGMVLSSSPIPEMVPMRAGCNRRALHHGLEQGQRGRRRVCQDRHPLTCPCSTRSRKRWTWWRRGKGNSLDLSRIDPEDPNGLRHDQRRASPKGVFLLQSPAQLKMAQRLKSRNLLDLAYQVALIRPGVGVQGSAVSQFVERYRHGVEWEYDHPLERRALERGYGVIVLAGAGRPAHRGRGGHDRGGGRRGAPCLRQAQQRAPYCHALGEVRGGRAAKRSPGGGRQGRYSPRSTATTCSPSPTPTPSPSPPTRPRGSSATTRWSSSSR